MNSPTGKKNRGQRVTGLEPVPRLSTQIWLLVTRGDVLLRVSLCFLATVIMVIATRAWAPPFAYREGVTPLRDIVASVDFKVPNPNRVERERESARRQAWQVYSNNQQPLQSLQTELLAEIAKLTGAEDFDSETQTIWETFLPHPTPDDTASPDDMKILQQQWEKQFDAFRSTLDGPRRLQFSAAIEKAFADIEKRGLFEKLEKEQGNQTEILVYPEREWEARERVDVQDVQIANAKFTLQETLQRELAKLELEAKDLARKEARQVYINNPEPLKQLRKTLSEEISLLRDAKDLDETTKTIWQHFLPVTDESSTPPSSKDQQTSLKQFRELLTPELAESLETVLAATLGEFEHRGILIDLKLLEEVAEGNQEEIIVVDGSENTDSTTVAVTDVRLADIKPHIRERLETQIPSLEVAGRIFSWLEKHLPAATTLKYRPATEKNTDHLTAPELAERASFWLHNRLPVTLTYDDERAKEVRDAVAAEVIPEEFATPYHAGDDALAKADRPIDAETNELLHAEYQAQLQHLTRSAMFTRLLAVFGMYLAIYSLCGLFIYFRFPEILIDLRRFCGLLGLTVLTVVVCYLSEHWKVELIPVLLFGMTVAIAYNQEISLLMSAAVGLIVVLLLGHGLIAFVILMAATATAILMLRRIRSRVKLVYVGICAGIVAMLTSIGASIVDGQPLDHVMLIEAGRVFLWGVVSGFAMTGLLPFIEHLFGVLTEISLLELGDVAHPLLQELVRRAPGTYNHSINVASMAEAAGESIGAQGLLLRVGAYFHDVGKMLKPQYFIENQGENASRHESLVPAMSTLIIIAHVKDGADLARQHHLPQSIIDFIQQHHGTTLVEYFYRRASEHSETNPDGTEIDENAFRYPGPKPQTKENGILMLADAVESASRVLVEPTPARIESLVKEIAMKRLLDGQLDECGLTLQEVRTVQDSLVKSLIAVYHGRVKYPDQKTA